MTDKIIPFLLTVSIAYFAGAIPFAYIISYFKGVDIRKVGSGNVGATNVYRSVSKSLGILTFVLDVLKGWLPVKLAPLIFKLINGREYSGLELMVICAVATVVGHTYPVYLLFRGGKGVATGAGALSAVAPYSLITGLGIWLVTFICSRYVSLASILAALSVAVSAWVFYTKDHYFLRPIVLSLLAAVVIWRHKSNIMRLIHGTEYKLASKTNKI